MEAKELVLDRIEQSFELFKNNFKTLFVPLFLYSFIATISTVIASFLLISNIDFILNNDSINHLSIYELLYSSEMVIYVLIGICLLLIYLILYIPFLIGAIKSLSQAYRGEKPNAIENLNYGFKNLGNSFKTYWYIFAYVALIPAVLFILGGIVTLYGMQYEQDLFTNIGGVIILISVILFIIFSIYRGLRSTFGIYSAVDSNTYSSENFKESLQYTKTKVLRIFGNLILVGFIGGLLVGIAQGVIDSISSFSSIGLDSFINEISYNDDTSIEEVQFALSQMLESYSPIMNIISSTLQSFISTLLSTFVIVFTYILFKRLEIENGENAIEKDNTDLESEL